jgi:hypothetical protein
MLEVEFQVMARSSSQQPKMMCMVEVQNCKNLER